MRGRVVPALTLCVLVLAGCGGSDTKSAATTTDAAKEAGSTASTTVASGATTSPAGTPESIVASDLTPTTVGDQQFQAFTDQINASIDKAGDDPCKILAVLEDQTPAPANAAQTEAAVGVFVNLLGKLADAAPDSAAASAKIVSDTVDKLDDSAEAVGYDPEKVSSLPELMSPEFGQAIGAIKDASACKS